MILVLDMNWKKDSLAFSEFMSPILSVVEPLEACTVRHYLQLEPSEMGDYSRIILSGTTLKDFEFLKHLEKFRWIKTWEKPLLGICAGMQIIIQVYGEALLACSQIGMTEVATLKENHLFNGVFQAYALHTYTIKPSNQTFVALAESSKCIQAIKHKQKPIYGVLFHPEVRNQNILQRFVRL
jgi:GMP synthase-like glutamine amidotransferase